MTRERRSLWRSISTSKKVNRLSVKAALLYTWSIPWFDDEGFQEGDNETLKHNVVPFRREIPLNQIQKLVDEIASVHERLGDTTPLWIVHKIGRRVFIEDPVFLERQPFKGIHRIPSKIKPLIQEVRFPQHPTGCIDTPQREQAGTPPGDQVKLSKVKRSKGEGVSVSSFLKPEIQKIVNLKSIEAEKNGVIERKALLREQAKKLIGGDEV